MKHKHAELIHAWADGAQIQCKQHGYENCWADVGYPNWENPYCVYRIKPTPKPDLYKYVNVKAVKGGICKWNTCLPDEANLRLTFYSETGRLKSAKVL